jgi:hypothetical protein
LGCGCHGFYDFSRPNAVLVISRRSVPSQTVEVREEDCVEGSGSLLPSGNAWLPAIRCRRMATFMGIVGYCS